MKIKITKEDKLWAELVKERDGMCRRCGKKPPYKLDTHHIRPRARSSTRFDLTNGLSLCVHCHRFGGNAVHNSMNQKAWLIEVIGLKEFNRLEKLSLIYKSREKAKRDFLNAVSKMPTNESSSNRRMVSVRGL